MAPGKHCVKAKPVLATGHHAPQSNAKRDLLLLITGIVLLVKLVKWTADNPELAVGLLHCILTGIAVLGFTGGGH